MKTQQHDIINDFIEALEQRARQVGGIGYAMGFLYGTLMSLNLKSHELDQLQISTKHLHELHEESN